MTFYLQVRLFITWSLFISVANTKRSTIYLRLNKQHYLLLSQPLVHSSIYLINNNIKHVFNDWCLDTNKNETFLDKFLYYIFIPYLAFCNNSKSTCYTSLVPRRRAEQLFYFSSASHLALRRRSCRPWREMSLLCLW